MLSKERKKLRDVDSFTIVDYIKTSIEILMNMRMEEYEGDKEHRKDKSKTDKLNNLNPVSDTESFRSTIEVGEPPKDYE